MHRALTIQKKPVHIVLQAVEFASCRLILQAAALSMLQWRRAREVCSWINQFCGRSEPGNSNLEQFRGSAFLLSSQKKGKTHNWPPRRCGRDSGSDSARGSCGTGPAGAIRLHRSYGGEALPAYSLPPLAEHQCHIDQFALTPPTKSAEDLFTKARVGHKAIVKFAPAGVSFSVITCRPPAVRHSSQSTTVKIHYFSHELAAIPAEWQMEKFAFGVAIDCSDQARVITAHIEKERRRHQLCVAHVVIFVLVQTLEPGPVSDGILCVVAVKPVGNVFTRQTARNKVRHIIRSVRAGIETRAVKRIDEPSRIAHNRPTVIANFFAVIR